MWASTPLKGITSRCLTVCDSWQDVKMENPLSPMSSEAPVSSPLTPHHQHMVLETPHPHNEDQEGFLYYSRGNNLNTPLKPPHPWPHS